MDHGYRFYPNVGRNSMIEVEKGTPRHKKVADPAFFSRFSG
jgi:hypothetical protein